MLGIPISVERDGATVEVDFSELTQEEMQAHILGLPEEDRIEFAAGMLCHMGMLMHGANTEEVVEIAQDGRCVQHGAMALPTFTQEPGAVVRAIRMYPCSDNTLWPTYNQARQRELAIIAKQRG